MILTLDIGNTNIKMGAWDNDQLAFVSCIGTAKLSTDDEYAVKLMELFRLNECNRNQFDGAIISSVVPALSPVLSRAVMRVIQSPRIYQVSAGLKIGLNIKIDNPAVLGADIVSAAVAAIAKYPLPIVIVSLGTATTLFVVNKKGEMIGGAVAPGARISLEALSRGTAQLPHIGLDNPGNLIGTNTIDSMKSGVIYGWASLVDGMIDRMREELGSEVTVVAYGGDSSVILAHCREPVTIDEDLIMEGLKIIYHKNAK